MASVNRAADLHLSSDAKERQAAPTAAKRLTCAATGLGRGQKPARGNGPPAPHAGDMPNQFVGPSGTISVQVLNTNVTLEAGTGTLFDDDGSALVIHSGPDDYTSQPADKAGDRIACGVIERP